MIWKQRVERKVFSSRYVYSTQSYYERGLMQILTGSIRLEQNGIHHELEAGETLLMLPKTKFRLVSDQGFEGFGFYNFKSGAHTTHHEVIIVPSSPELVSLGNQMVQTFSSYSRFTRDLALGIGEHFAALCFESISPQLDRTPDDLEFFLEEVEQTIQSRISEQITLQDLFRNLPISYEHLSRAFKNKTGQSLYEYRLFHRMERAKDLLKNSDQSITQIAYELGFSSSQHFSTKFHESNGYSPTDYRNREKAA